MEITAASRRLSANFCSNLAGIRPQADPMKTSLTTASGAFRLLLTGVAAGVLLACQVGLAQPAIELPDPSPSASGRLDALSRELEAAVASSPQLAGAWVSVEIDDQAGDTESADRFVFRRTLDATKADAQRSEIDRIIRSLLPAGGFRVDAASDRTLPLGSLLGSLRDLTSRDVRFEGCKVLDAGYRPNADSESLDLVPRFQVAREGQFEALIDECRKLVAREPRWHGIAVQDLDKNKGQMQLVPEVGTPDANQLLRTIGDAIATIPELQGSWIDVETDDQGHPDVAPLVYRFTRGFDNSRVATQSAAMDSLIQRLVPNGRFRIDSSKDKSLPLSELLESLRNQIDIDSRFAGCWLSDATYRYNEDDETFDLVLHGRAWKSNQDEMLAELCRYAMQRDPIWQSMGVKLQDPKRGDFTLTTPALDRSAVYFSQAMHHFWKREYGEADRLLALACIEDPDNVTYRYWRAIGDFERGDEALAETRILNTVIGYDLKMNSRRYNEVLKSIYRIQGPVRHKLIAAERKAMIAATSPRSAGNGAIAAGR